MCKFSFCGRGLGIDTGARARLRRRAPGLLFGVLTFALRFRDFRVLGLVLLYGPVKISGWSDGQGWVLARPGAHLQASPGTVCKAKTAGHRKCRPSATRVYDTVGSHELPKTVRSSVVPWSRLSVSQCFQYQPSMSRKTLLTTATCH